VELHHRGERVAVMDRIIGGGKHRIDYRQALSSSGSRRLPAFAG
jgi:hypothetical protein